MRTIGVAVIAALGLVISVCTCQAQDLEVMSIGQATLREATEPGGEADMKADKTGTNPINFQDTFIFWNEYIDLGDACANSTSSSTACPRRKTR